MDNWKEFSKKDMSYLEDKGMVFSDVINNPDKASEMISSRDKKTNKTSVTYSEKTAIEIKERLAKGEALVTICKSSNMPTKKTAQKWIDDNKWGVFEKTDNPATGNKKGGRPSIYTEEMADEILLRIAEGESIRQITADDHMPKRSTIHFWVIDDREGFRSQYETAMEIKMMGMAEDISDIADDGSNDYYEKQRPDGSTFVALDNEHISRSKLRVDARKWLLSKLLPKFADKQNLDHTSSDGSMTPTEIEMVVMKNKNK